jgi:hypothetical protein
MSHHVQLRQGVLRVLATLAGGTVVRCQRQPRVKLWQESRHLMSAYTTAYVSFSAMV